MSVSDLHGRLRFITPTLARNRARELSDLTGLRWVVRTDAGTYRVVLTRSDHEAIT